MSERAHSAGFDAAAMLRLFERLREGGGLSETLREAVHLVVKAAAPWSAQAVLLLRDATAPLVMVGVPAVRAADPGELFVQLAGGAELLSAQHPAVSALGAPAGYPVVGRYGFSLPSKLEGVLVVLAAAEAEASLLDWLGVAGSAVASLVAAWDAARQLTELRERHSLESQVTQHVVYDWDIPNDVLVWNPRMETVFGHPASPDSEEIGWWKAQLHPDDRERAWNNLERALREKELFWTCEYRFRRADGQYAWVFDRGTLVYDLAGRATRMLGVMEDISRDRELETKLRTSSRLAAVGSLASGIAHEINNPLAWVTSNLAFAVEELKKIGRDPEHQEACEEIAEALDDSQTGATRIAQIVSDLRTFAHAESDRLAPVNVRRVVEGALTVANNELKHRARVVRRLDDVPMVMANEARLGHAVLNLLLNAGWSAGTPGISPEVLVATGVGPGGQALVEVVDNGMALATEVLPHLFDPFYSPRPGAEGLGLGLAVTHSIISSFGGVIEVESTVRTGTCFRVLLPAVTDEQPAPPPPAIEVRVARPQPLVMVIDDEPAIITAIARMLEPVNEVLGFTSGREALAALGRVEPDLILCDVMMPDMSGAEVWASLQADRAGLLSRFALLTGGAFTPDAEAFVARCPAPLLDKPFNPAELRAFVARYAGRAA